VGAGDAPGARLWSVKVLSDSGSGSTSGVIAGIDWVTARADRIEVANMSLGGPSSTAMNDAIRRSVDAGVIHAVAAGNDDQDARNKSPANSPDVITVSALADFNGAAGGGGAPTCRTDQDDTLADFSNWGPAIEITAPGVCIYSTYRAGGYSTLSGTSMASPHTAGAVAILASAANDPRNRTDVQRITQALLAAGNFAWTDDSGDGIKEPLLDARALSSTPPDPGAPIASFTYTCDNPTLTCNFDGTASSDPDGTITAYAWNFGDGTTGSGPTVSHRYAAFGTYTVRLTVTDNSGKTASTTRTLTVGRDPTLPVARYTYSCSGLTCNFDATTSSDDGTITQYKWEAVSGGSSWILYTTRPTASHTFNNPGLYTVTLTVTDNTGKTDSTTKQIQIG